MIVILQIILAFLALSLAFYNYFKSDSKQYRSEDFSHLNSLSESEADYLDFDTEFVDLTKDLKQHTLWESFTELFNCCK